MVLEKVFACKINEIVINSKKQKVFSKKLQK